MLCDDLETEEVVISCEKGGSRGVNQPRRAGDIGFFFVWDICCGLLSVIEVGRYLQLSNLQPLESRTNGTGATRDMSHGPREDGPIGSGGLKVGFLRMGRDYNQEDGMNQLIRSKSLHLG
jgi:hypothetical protein